MTRAAEIRARLDEGTLYFADVRWLLDRADELAAALALRHIEGCHSGCASIDGECTARVALARYRGDE